MCVWVYSVCHISRAKAWSQQEHTGWAETAPVTVINRPNREIRDYRSVDDGVSLSVDERVFPDVSKDTV
jgi:hypothetical protein